MSKTVGIIAEYNPFHTGHLYQIDSLKEKGIDNIVIIQSGSCVQRGEMSVFSKFLRSKAAVLNGASLVVELPFPYSSLSAEGFAFSSVSLLKEIGVDAICFGSESDDISLLKSIAEFLLSEEYTASLKFYLNKKMPFAKAREKALLDKFEITNSFVTASNDILAIEYIKAAIMLSFKVEFIPLKRKGALYNDLKEKDGFASATMLRESISNYKWDKALNFLPKNTHELVNKALNQGEYFVFDKTFERSLLFSLKNKKSNFFLKLPDCNEELSHAFENAFLESSSIEMVYSLLPTKTYTKSRLQRIMLYGFLNLEKNFPRAVPYIRILAIGKNGEQIIKEKSKDTTLPFSHSIKRIKNTNPECAIVADYENRAFTAFSSFSKTCGDSKLDFTNKLFKL